MVQRVQHSDDSGPGLDAGLHPAGYQGYLQVQWQVQRRLPTQELVRGVRDRLRDVLELGDRAQHHQRLQSGLRAVPVLDDAVLRHDHRRAAAQVRLQLEISADLHQHPDRHRLPGRGLCRVRPGQPELRDRAHCGAGQRGGAGPGGNGLLRVSQQEDHEVHQLGHQLMIYMFCLSSTLMVDCLDNIISYPINNAEAAALQGQFRARVRRYPLAYLRAQPATDEGASVALRLRFRHGLVQDPVGHENAKRNRGQDRRIVTGVHFRK